MTYKDEIVMLMERIETRRSLCFRELRHLPVGELRIENNGKYQQYRRYYKRNEEIIRESVGRNPELVRQLKRRAFFEEEIKLLNEDLRILSDAAASLKGNEFETVVKMLKNGLDKISYESTFMSDGSGLLIPCPVDDVTVPVRELELKLGDIDPNDWAVMPYRENTSFPEEKQHVGVTGLRYRSRAELHIFEHIVTERKQPIHYDELVEIDGEWFSPDGLGPNIKGDIILIEYMELNNAEYIRSNARKLEAYRRKGFYCGRNLIILSCENNGYINIPKLDKILDAYFLT